ncbi:MAG: hypothetical protein WC551_11480 [Patescibacteria group bacterium]
MTAPKWYVKTENSEFGTIYQLRDANNGIVAESPHEADGEKYERIAECMNACSGLNPEAIPGLVEAAKRVKRWRDTREGIAGVILYGLGEALRALEVKS